MSFWGDVRVITASSWYHSMVIWLLLEVHVKVISRSSGHFGIIGDHLGSSGGHWWSIFKATFVVVLIPAFVLGWLISIH